VALDRQSVEKKDFPIARRGYDPEAVDAHLARLADEIDALQRQAPVAEAPRSSSGESLALAASEQVRAIVEAAESSAAEIERSARDDAERIRSTAEAEAARVREDAVTSSQEHVGKVSESTTLMLQRVSAMENEIGALIESLRTGTNRLNADLSLLQGNMGELYTAAGGTQLGAGSPGPGAPSAAERSADEPTTPLVPSVSEPSAAEAEVAAAPVPAAPAPSAPAGGSGGEGADIEGARLIALNMALNGQSREETDRYLQENFDLPDRGALLDEVYATVEG
jgi:DivIVA domain-containing protein